MPITDRYDDGLASINADVVTNPGDYETFVAVFGRTYSHSEGPAAVVDFHHDYQQIRANTPTQVVTKLGVPRSNIRRWTDDDAVPYVVQGLQTAEVQGWVPMNFESPEFRGMNRLVA